MARCDFIDACPFLNAKMIDMPITTHSLVENYCYGNFTMCTIHNVAVAHGSDNVPKDVSPGDKYELSEKMINLIFSGRFGW